MAEAYPAWTGVTPKNHVCGRQIFSPADLRQRVTIVVEFDAAKAHEQLEKTGRLSTYNFAPAAVEGTSWETFEMPRDVMIVFVARNLKDREAFMEAKKATDHIKNPGLWQIRSYNPAIYENVTFEGAPDNGGKLPFVYVMGYEGKEPLLKEPYAATTPGAISRAIAAQKKALMEKELKWKPFYGYVAEPKHFTGLDKLLKAGKPLEPFQAKTLKGVASHDSEVAKEAQMLYDALEQTRDDYIFLAACELAHAPHVAAYHMNLVLKYWPKVKKQFTDVAAQLKNNAEAKPLVTIYPKIRQWADPEFTCKNAGEAKKIVAELNKYKKMLEPMKENSKNISVQNGATVLDSMLDELIAIVPTKVPQK